MIFWKFIQNGNQMIVGLLILMFVQIAQCNVVVYLCHFWMFFKGYFKQR